MTNAQTSFDRILIANRGEIAVRVIRTARDLGLKTVAVYTTADAHAPHVALADDAVLIGDGPVGDSYLDASKILAAARQSGAGAIHPGYGFLSENAAFAEAVADAGLVFIGPSPTAIRAMGNKAEAKRLMIAAGVPCVPGYEGAEQSDETLIAAAQDIGFPIMVKASAGGGGRGMRLVTEPGQLPEALALARSEAQNAFGSGELILEKAIIAPRHVEVQIFADQHGTCLHLGERDCSVQRRHQKVVEEAPCPIMTPDLRDRMGTAAVNAAKAVDYCGAGTVEFLLDDAGEFYFLEMNTRLQVEHPVTELVTGQDLVALQIAVAQGDPLPFSQDDVMLQGHAIEVRLYAEDPANDFLPTIGPINLWQPATGEGVRIDAGIREGQEVSPFYDPLLAKIIAHGPNREVARQRLIRAVGETALLGTTTNAAFLIDVLKTPDFIAGQATTALLETTYPDGVPNAGAQVQDFALAAALMSEADKQAALERAGHVTTDQLHWSSAPLVAADMLLSSGETRMQLEISACPDGWFIRMDEDEMTVALERLGQNDVQARIAGQTLRARFVLKGDQLALWRDGRQITVDRQRPGQGPEDRAANGQIAAPIPGLVQSLLVHEGAQVAKGETLAVLEAMKMQHQIMADIAGRVSAVHVVEGQQLSNGQIMIEIDGGV